MKKLVFFLTLMSSLFSMDLTKYGIVISASNMEFVMTKIFEKFYQKYPNNHILVQYFSSGKAKENILNGYDYDMFLSANKKDAMAVYKINKAVTKPRLYTQGSLIIFYKNLKYDKNYSFLKNKKVKKILVGNKENAVYGNRTIQVLNNLHIYNKIKNKIIYKRNIAEVVDNVLWSKDKVGFIPKSATTLLPDQFNKEGTNWMEVDPKLYSPIKQYFIISKRGIKKQSIINFANFLLSDEGQKILTSNGYLSIR